MAIQEIEIPLRVRIKGQINVNRIRGDKESFLGCKWICYGRSIDDYEETFNGVLNGKHIKNFLEGKKNLVVVDLMSPSWGIGDLFRYFGDTPKLGLAVSLEDLREEWIKIEDKRSNIVQIAGDILQYSTWKKIKEQLNGRKADLIMERALSGLDCIPRDFNLYTILLKKAWRLLSKENGVLIAELPNGGFVSGKIMVDEFKKKGIEATLGMSQKEYAYAIKLVKTPQSPKKLPFPRSLPFLA